MRTNATRYAKKNIHDIVKRYNKGDSLREIAWEYGIAEGTVRNYLKLNNVRMRKTNWKKLSCWEPKSKVDIVQRYERGDNTRDIARDYGVTSGTIVRVLIKCGQYICRRPILTEWQVRKLHSRYMDGESTPQLAKSVNVCASTMQYTFKRYGLALRTLSQGKYLLHKKGIYHDAHLRGKYTSKEEYEFMDKLVRELGTRKLLYRNKYGTYTKYLGGKHWDAYIPKLNLLIEYDGEFVHPANDKDAIWRRMTLAETLGCELMIVRPSTNIVGIIADKIRSKLCVEFS